MNVLVVGITHHTAPVGLLERVSVSPDQTPELLSRLLSSPYVDEAVVLSTCNRVEVYAAVAGFHGGLTQIGAVLAERAGVPLTQLSPRLSAHFGADAVRHTMRVAAGLDSMVVGEAQILGQLRDAYQASSEHDATGRLLHELMQQALRVGKRVHAETQIDAAGRSVVAAALDLVPGGVAGRSALVVGAGSMGALALATLTRCGASTLLVANRGAERAVRLAESYGGQAVLYADIVRHVADVDIVVSATASPAAVLTESLVSAALAARDQRTLSIVDLALPRDVEPEVAALRGVHVIDLDTIATTEMEQLSTVDSEAAEAIVAAEVEAFLSWLRGAAVSPAVAALRARADELVGAELSRLWRRHGEFSEEQRADIVQTLHRVVRQLLHRPTVRARELAAGPEGERYVDVLQELFDLAVPESDTGLERAIQPSLLVSDADEEVAS